jgi:uncharacterized protein with HEPN domain
MSRDSDLLLDMLTFARRAHAAATELGRAGFDEDELRRGGLLKMIQDIGEAAAHVSNEFRDSHREIPWRSIINARNRIVHDYGRIDAEVVWDTLR